MRNVNPDGCAISTDSGQADPAVAEGGVEVARLLVDLVHVVLLQ